MALSPAAFCKTLVAGGSSEATAQFLLEEVRPYYPALIAPDPSDRWEGTMRIDPEELEAIAERYFERFSLELPSRREPVELPPDPTLQEFAIWLEGQRVSRQAVSPQMQPP